jgi:hypothetical protein
MFTTLTSELLDLTAGELGVRPARLALNLDACCCCTCCTCLFGC